MELLRLIMIVLMNKQYEDTSEFPSQRPVMRQCSISYYIAVFYILWVLIWSVLQHQTADYLQSLETFSHQECCGLPSTGLWMG